MLILRGAPGVGKSTFIKDNNLQPYTLCADDFRLQLSAPVMGLDGKMTINQKVSRKAWENLFAALESRMQEGSFIVVDATHTRQRDMNQYKKYADKYNYKVYCLTFEVELETILKQNAQREEYRQVPESVIETLYNRCHVVDVPEWIKPVESLTELLETPEDVNEYDKVMVIGDVHGCYTALQECLGKIDENTLYVFAGDLLDRGIENKETIDFCLKHKDDKNFIFVEGNHDTHLRNFANNTFPKNKDGSPHKPLQFKTFTESEIQEGRDREDRIRFRKDLRDFTRKLRDCYWFEYRGKTYFVNHGGISDFNINPLFINTKTLIKGVGAYNYNVDYAYNVNTQGTDKPIQIHGHRPQPIPVAEVRPSIRTFCLEDKVFSGGNLVALLISGNNRTYIRVKNTVFDLKKICKIF